MAVVRSALTGRIFIYPACWCKMWIFVCCLQTYKMPAWVWQSSTPSIHKILQPENILIAEFCQNDLCHSFFQLDCTLKRCIFMYNFNVQNWNWDLHLMVTKHQNNIGLMALHLLWLLYCLEDSSARRIWKNVPASLPVTPIWHFQLTFYSTELVEYITRTSFHRRHVLLSGHWYCNAIFAHWSAITFFTFSSE